ncbi:MAG: response regulator transcription factor [Lachnospiraceae bacterium]|nr:response regulator transcription factor [Lachnospiraceae bacterium]
MKERILVIEDSAAINELICINLETAGYEPLPFWDGDAVSTWLHDEKRQWIDLALLDVMLPGKDGFALLPQLRALEIPVIFLTAKGDLNSKIHGLKDGAEDYIVKPFEMLELLVRVEKVLARYRKEAEIFVVRDVEIFPEERRVTKAGREISLKPMEFDCLLQLVKYKNIALSREQLINALWGVDFDGETRTIDVHIARLRKKLDFQDVIQTVPRIGYRLNSQ